MAYASIQDVEARGGIVFNESDASTITAFIEDFSVYIDIVVEQAGRVPEILNPNVLKIIVSRHALDFYFNAQRGGITSKSEAVGDVSQSITYEEAGFKNDDLFYLTAREKTMLGLNNSGFVSWSFVEPTRGV